MRITREQAVQKILHSHGRIFSVSWTTRKGQARKLNGNFRQTGEKRLVQDKIYGYLTIYDPRQKHFRRIDTRTINRLAIDKEQYTVK